MPDSADPLITLGRTVSIDQAAALLGCSRRTVYNRIRSGHLQTIRTANGASQRVTVESIVQLQQFHALPPSTPPVK